MDYEISLSQMAGDPLFFFTKIGSFPFPSIFKKKMKKSDREKRSIYYLGFRLKEGKFTPFSTGHDKQFSFQNLVFNKWDETSNKYLLNRLVWVTPNKKSLPATVFFLKPNRINCQNFYTGYL